MRPIATERPVGLENEPPIVTRPRFDVLAVLPETHDSAPAGSAETNTPADELHLVPWPKSVKVEPGTFELANKAGIVAGDNRLMALAELVADEIFQTTGLRLEAR